MAKRLELTAMSPKIGISQVVNRVSDERPNSLTDAVSEKLGRV